MKKIVLLLLAFCLLCSPAMASYAGTSFEGHPSEDFQVSDFDPCGEGSILPVEMEYEGRTVLFFNYNVDPGIEVHHPFTSCGFSLKYSNSNPDWSCFKVALYNESGDITISSQELTDIVSTDGWTNIWFYLDTEANVIRIYEDGVYQKQISCGVPTSSFSKLRLWNLGNSYNYYLDDLYFDEDEYIGTCSPVTAEDTTIYYSYSIFPVAGYDYYIQIEDEDGTILTTNDISNCAGVSSFTRSSYISTEGTYYIRLYAEDTIYPTHPVYFLESNYFEYDIPESASFSINNPEVSPGDVLKIYCHDASGYLLSIGGGSSSSGTLPSTEHTITSDSCTVSYTVPSSAIASTPFIYLISPSGEVAQYEQYSIIAPIGDTAVSLDHIAYYNSDTAKISYSNLPSETSLSARLFMDSTIVYSYSWIVSGSGVKSLDLGGYAANRIVVDAIKDGTVYGEDQALIIYGEEFSLSGKIYDSITGAPVSGATITVGAESDTTDTYGKYDLTVPAGISSVTIEKTGYNTLYTSVNVYELLSTQNYHIVPSYSTDTGSLYGSVVDSYSGAAIPSVCISLKNETTGYTVLTTSTGNYIFDYPNMAGNWTLKATKTDYDSYVDDINISGDTYYIIKMAPVSGPTAPGGDDDDSSTSSDTDRPDRENARESLLWLENAMPNLIKLVVFVFVCALFGVKF